MVGIFKIVDGDYIVIDFFCFECMFDRCVFMNNFDVSGFKSIYKWFWVVVCCFNDFNFVVDSSLCVFIVRYWFDGWQQCYIDIEGFVGYFMVVGNFFYQVFGSGLSKGGQNF